MTSIIGRSVEIKKIETPLCRIGSKRPIRDNILENSPKEFKTYIEPFLGSGYIYFYLDIDPNKTKSVLNDKDPLISETFKLLKKSPKGLIDYYKEEFTSKDRILLSLKNNIKFTNFVYNKKNKTDFEKLASNIIQLCGTFSSIGSGKIYKRSGIQRKLNDVIDGKYKKYMKNTIITNDDFENVIKKYDNKDSFIFLDPPYEGSETTYKFGEDILQKLSKILKTIKGKFLLTVNDSRRTRLLFKDYNIIPIEVKGGSYTEKRDIRKLGNVIRNELIIKNY